MRKERFERHPGLWRYFIKPDEQATGSSLKGRFTGTFLLISVILLLVVLSFNIVVDPYDMYPSNIIKPIVWSDRRQKLQLFEEYNFDPELVVLGSSRMMRINTALLDSLTGLHGFNLAVNRARTEDFLALLRYAYLTGKTHSIKYAIVGLDVHEFRGYYAMDNLLNYYPELLSYLNSDGEADWKRSLEVFWTKFTKGLSLHQTEMSIKSVSTYLTSGHWDIAYKFSSDGTMLRNLTEDNQNGLNPEIVNGKIDSAVKQAKLEFQGFGGFSQTRIGFFKDLVKFCQARNIELICVILPYQQRFIEQLRDSAFEEINGQWMELVENMALEYDFTLLNAFNPDVIKFDQRQYYDEVHMTSENSDKLVKFIVESASPGGSDSF